MSQRPPKKRKPKPRRPARTNQPARQKTDPAVPPQLVEIEKPIYGGSFLARIAGKAVFVPLTLPGEQASVRIVEEKQSYAAAEAEEIFSRAPERSQPRCPYFGSCGGCQYQHASYEAQLRFKRAILRETLERAGVPAPDKIEVLSADPWGYRNRIRLAFDVQGNPGYRARRSHHIIPIRQCPISANVLIDAADAFAHLARSQSPDLRSIEIALFCNHDESAVLASLFVQQQAIVALDPLAGPLKQRIPALTGMDLIAEGRPGQLPRTLAQWGERSLVYSAAGTGYRVDHGAFFQVNRWLVDSLIQRVTANHAGNSAWDLFAGVGLFARQLAANFERVTAVESAPSATAALSHNLAGTTAKASPSSTLEFLRCNVKSDRPDLIVVDPPRTGLGPDTTALLNRIAAPALTYVSCDPATLARDLRALIAGGYTVQRLTLADLFPQTFHLETVVDLQLA
jgi:23S rRNA (uracil1939-C5)-methyltransferase